ncbi:MAG TPA: NRDE family protein [Burkholderiales bacterium]|nr:NRDE family protein [Burkholderiales bacterium]
MCVILFSAGAHARYPLIVAANRDEAYDRPAAPAGFWNDHPHVCAGRDLTAGGTWLGLSTTGRFAAITNYRQGIRAGAAPRSRGALTSDFLTGRDEPSAYMEEAARHGDDYGGYSLIAGTPERLYFCSNRGVAPHAVAPGVHGLSNRLLDEPWPKVQRGMAVLESLADASEAALLEGLFEVLADTAAAPDHLLPSTGITLERERDLSALFIPGGSYGTRASTVVLVREDGGVVFVEKSFGPRGKPLGIAERRFRLEPSAIAALQATP